MKKPGFIITETIFSLVLAASVAAVAVLAVDLQTDQFHIDRYNPFVQQTSEDSKETKAEPETKKESSVVKEETSAPESQQSSDNPYSSEVTADISEDTSAQADVSPEASMEEPKKEESKKEESKPEQSKPETTSGDIHILAEPQNLKQQPKELVEALTRYGCTLEGEVDGNKAIIVETTGTGDKTKAILYCFQKSSTSNYWWNVIGEGKAFCTEARIAVNGSDYEPKAGAKVTPGGVHMAGEAFYIDDKPKTTYSMFQITEDTYWVTYPNSKFYNQKVEGTAQKDWTKADHMIENKEAYKYGLTIKYNTSKPDKNKECEFFIQCGGSPTEGSIAVPEKYMKAILEWLDSDTSVTVFVTI